MSDLIYDVVCGICRPIVWMTSHPMVLHADRVPRRGPMILASSHLTPFDVPMLMAMTPRHLDFLSIVEMERKPFVGTLFRLMNVTFLDRERSDYSSMRTLTAKLQDGRAVAMFPEGGIRREAQSVIHGGSLKSGVIKLAAMTGAPIVPCVVLGAGNYRKVESWLPTASVRCGTIFGKSIRVPADSQNTSELTAAFVELAAELKAALAKTYAV
jgi:1-acyl-sn-glycerol-3-phosphate acyltransferase